MADIDAAKLTDINTALADFRSEMQNFVNAFNAFELGTPILDKSARIAVIKNSTTFALAANTLTTLPFDTVISDEPGDMADVANNQIVCPIDGVVFCTFGLQIASFSSSNRAVAYITRYNSGGTGLDYVGQVAHYMVYTQTNLSLCGTFRVLAGDSIRFRMEAGTAETIGHADTGEQYRGTVAYLAKT